MPPFRLRLRLTLRFDSYESEVTLASLPQMSKYSRIRSLCGDTSDRLSEIGQRNPKYDKMTGLIVPPTATPPLLSLPGVTPTLFFTGSTHSVKQTQQTRVWIRVWSKLKRPTYGHTKPITTPEPPPITRHPQDSADRQGRKLPTKPYHRSTDPRVFASQPSEHSIYTLHSMVLQLTPLTLEQSSICSLETTRRWTCIYVHKA